MRCCEAMLYILQMAPEFPVKPRVDSCNSPLLGHQMPPEAVFPPASMGSFRFWYIDIVQLTSPAEAVHGYIGMVQFQMAPWQAKTATASNPRSILQSAAKSGDLQMCLQNLEQILHFGKLTGQNCPSLFTLLGNGFITDASSRIVRKFRLGAFFEPKSGLWSIIKLRDTDLWLCQKDVLHGRFVSLHRSYLSNYFLLVSIIGFWKLNQLIPMLVAPWDINDMNAISIPFPMVLL